MPATIIKGKVIPPESPLAPEAVHALERVAEIVGIYTGDHLIDPLPVPDERVYARILGELFTALHFAGAHVPMFIDMGLEISETARREWGI